MRLLVLFRRCGVSKWEQFDPSPGNFDVYCLSVAGIGLEPLWNVVGRAGQMPDDTKGRVPESDDAPGGANLNLPFQPGYVVPDRQAHDL